MKKIFITLIFSLFFSLVLGGFISSVSAQTVSRAWNSPVGFDNPDEKLLKLLTAERMYQAKNGGLNQNVDNSTSNSTNIGNFIETNVISSQGAIVNNNSLTQDSSNSKQNAESSAIVADDNIEVNQ